MIAVCSQKINNTVALARKIKVAKAINIKGYPDEGS